ncbi:SGNH/GDSL hydrolase family protein [Undibacterium sp.]|uniref:SGNH/GDSL hydrolase family protein n=1 Tax=Undibacterium sp. TaxID=1914977 RepID=UPI0025FD52E6|nr:SGNH/GDSL hydrolase family protein [Undibacterium sp.]
MRQTKFTLALLTAVAVLAGCGGSTNNAGDQTPKFKYSAQVSFGDSLSDVGSYAVGTVLALKGGKFNINGNSVATNPALTGKNWTELMAAQLNLPAPCPAMTGLNGNAAKGLSVPVVNNPGCYGYAQGGARVTNPVGPENALTGSDLGALTVPVTTQIKNHLAAVGGKFKGDELVFVMAGGNDALMQLGMLSAGATKAGQDKFASILVGLLASGATNPATAAQAIGIAMATESARVGHTDESVVGAAVGAAAVQDGNSAVTALYGPMVITAKAAATTAGSNYAKDNGQAAVKAMSDAGAELVALVKTQIIANGATRVVVNNLPDLGTTPNGLSQSVETQGLINLMVKTFNDQLNAGLASEAKVVLVDVFSVSHDQATNPAPYGLTNVKDMACDLSPAKNPLKSSLVCNAANLVAGDVSHYQFADSVHPTPFGYLLLARYVTERLVVKGWM